MSQHAMSDSPFPTDDSQASQNSIELDGSPSHSSTHKRMDISAYLTPPTMMDFIPRPVLADVPMDETMIEDERALAKMREQLMAQQHQQQLKGKTTGKINRATHTSPSKFNTHSRNTKKQKVSVGKPAVNTMPSHMPMMTPEELQEHNDIALMSGFHAGAYEQFEDHSQASQLQSMYSDPVAFKNPEEYYAYKSSDVSIDEIHATRPRHLNTSQSYSDVPRINFSTTSGSGTSSPHPPMSNKHPTNKTKSSAQHHPQQGMNPTSRPSPPQDPHVAAHAISHSFANLDIQRHPSSTHDRIQQNTNNNYPSNKQSSDGKGRKKETTIKDAMRPSKLLDIDINQIPKTMTNAEARHIHNYRHAETVDPRQTVDYYSSGAHLESSALADRSPPNYYLTEEEYEQFKQRVANMHRKWVVDTTNPIAFYTRAFMNVFDCLKENTTNALQDLGLGDPNAAQQNMFGDMFDEEMNNDNNDEIVEPQFTVASPAQLEGALIKEVQKIEECFVRIIHNRPRHLDQSNEDRELILDVIYRLYSAVQTAFKMVGCWNQELHSQHKSDVGNAHDKHIAYEQMFKSLFNVESDHMKQSKYDFQRTLLFILGRLGDCYLLRGIHNDNVYVFTEVKTRQNQWATHFWKPVMSLEKFIYANTIKEVPGQMEHWLVVHSSKGHYQKLLHDLKTSPESEFYDINPLRGVYSFKNGIFDCWRNRWIPYGSNDHLALNARLHVYLYFPYDFPADDWDPVEERFTGDFMDTECPIFDACVETQEWDREMELYICFLLGRFLFPNGHDGTQGVAFLLGVSGSGKSTTMRQIAEYFPLDRRFILSSDAEITFGLGGLINKETNVFKRDAIFNPEVRGGGGMSLSQLLSTNSEDPVSLGCKYKDAVQVHQFTPTQLYAGNKPFSHPDPTIALKRRVHYIPFEHKPKDIKHYSTLDIRRESPALLKKIIGAYHYCIGRMKEMNTRDMWKIAPQPIRDLSDRLSEQSSLLFEFLNRKTEWLQEAPDQYISHASLAQIYRVYANQVKGKSRVFVPNEDTLVSSLISLYPEIQAANFRLQGKFKDWNGIEARGTFVRGFKINPDHIPDINGGLYLLQNQAGAHSRQQQDMQHMNSAQPSLSTMHEGNRNPWMSSNDRAGNNNAPNEFTEPQQRGTWQSRNGRNQSGDNEGFE